MNGSNLTDPRDTPDEKEIARLTTELAALRARLAGEEVARATAVRERDALRAELQEVRETCGSAVLAQHQAVERLESITQNNHALSDDVAELRIENNDLRQELDQLVAVKAELIRTKGERDTYIKHIGMIAEERDALRAEVTRLEAELKLIIAATTS